MVWMLFRSLDFNNRESLISLKSTKILQWAKINPWAEKQTTWWTPQGMWLWVMFRWYVLYYIPCFFTKPCSFQCLCMPWLLSCLSLSRWWRRLKTVLFYFVKQKLKRSEGKNVHWRNKGMWARKGKCRLNNMEKFWVQCLLSCVSWEKKIKAFNTRPDKILQNVPLGTILSSLWGIWLHLHWKTLQHFDAKVKLPAIFKHLTELRNQKKPNLSRQK